MKSFNSLVFKREKDLLLKGEREKKGRERDFLDLDFLNFLPRTSLSLQQKKKMRERTESNISGADCNNVSRSIMRETTRGREERREKKESR